MGVNASESDLGKDWNRNIKETSYHVVGSIHSHIQWQIAIEALIVRINQTVHIINLFFLWVTLSLGAKLNIFFFTLIILPFIFFFSFNHENRYIFYSWIALCALLWDLLALFFFFLLCFFKSVHECLYIKCYKYTCYYFYNKNVSSQLNWYTYKLFRQQNENKMWLMSCVNILMLLFYFISVLLFFLPFFCFSLTINCFVPKKKIVIK